MEQVQVNSLDGYALADRLEEGPTTLRHNGETYGFEFVGPSLGTDNYLLVTNEAGDRKRWGWGRGSEQVWQALEHLAKGWNQTQVPRYRRYGEGGCGQGE